MFPGKFYCQIMEKQMKIHVNGVDYYVEIYGNGAPLVLLHGFSGDSSTWTEIIDPLKVDYKVICLDIIGHGKTESPKEVERYNIQAVAEDIKNILDKLGIDKTVMLGYSMGGRLALTFALLFPDRVSALILESASPGLETENERESRKISDEKLAKRIVNEGIEKFVDYWESIPLFQSQLRLPHEKREKIRNARLNNNPLGLANSLLGMGTGAQPSWWSSLSTIKIPVLMITGEWDTKFCRIAEQMSHSIINCYWETILEAGHAIHVEQPEKFGKIVSEFLMKNKGGL